MVLVNRFYDNHRYCIIFHTDNQSNISAFEIDAFKHPRQQIISFRDPLINYILTSATLKTYLKLTGVCKQFYLRKNITLIPNIHLHFNSKERAYFKEMKVLKFHSSELSKIWITRQLQAGLYGKACPHYGLSEFCQKIYKCEASFVEIANQILTEEEFRFLILPEFVESVYLCFLIIQKRNGNFLFVEDIFERIPNATRINFVGLPVTHETFANLSKFSVRKKLKLFCYYSNREKDTGFHSKFDVQMFQTFVTNNASPNARFDIGFGYSTETTKKTLKVVNKKINSFVKSWIPQNQKPEIILGTEEKFPWLDDIYFPKKKWHDTILEANQLY